MGTPPPTDPRLGDDATREATNGAPPVRLDVRGRVLVVTLDRPHVHNCVDGETASLLASAWTRLRDEAELRAAVLTGQGDEAFCTGADLSALDALGPGLGPDSDDSDAAEARRAFVEAGPGYVGGTRWTDIDKPVVAAINGYAFAGGLELACLADLRIAEEHATFGVTCRRWNVPLVDGGTQRLPRIVGLGHAMDLILTGRVIDAREAHRMGLANEVVPRGQGLDRALAIADELAALPQEAMRADKASVMAGLGLPLEEGLRREAAIGDRVLGSEAFLRGVQRFHDRSRKGPPGRRRD